MPRGVLFDIDGTLMSTGGASDRAWHRAFLEIHGVDIDIARHTGRGVPDPEVGREAFVVAMGREPEPAELAALMERRLEHLPAELEDSPGFRLMPGIPDLLEALGDAGLLLGVTTGNVEPAAHMKLRRGRLNDYFRFGGFGSDSADRAELTRRALERAEAIVGVPLADGDFFSVGDTPRDIAAGHSAGIRVVAVATGEYSTAELLQAGADFAIESLAAGLPPELGALPVA